MYVYKDTARFKKIKFRIFLKQANLDAVGILEAGKMIAEVDVVAEFFGYVISFIPRGWARACLEKAG